MTEAEAAHAVALAFEQARQNGADHDTAIDVAIARYRAFLPEAPEVAIRQRLSAILAFKRPKRVP